MGDIRAGHLDNAMDRMLQLSLDGAAEAIQSTLAELSVTLDALQISRCRYKYLIAPGIIDRKNISVMTHIFEEVLMKLNVPPVYPVAKFRGRSLAEQY